MNTTTRFFQTKDQYLAFRNAFATVQKDKRSAHYLLFNLVTGKDYYSGFTPKTKKVFVENGGDPDRGLSGAISQLATVIEYANNLLGKGNVQAPSWIKDKKQFIATKTKDWQTVVNNFLEPLSGGFTLQDLARVNLPSFPGLTKDQIEQHKGKPLAYRELYGEQITDQTPDEDEIVVEQAPPVPEKKSLLGRIFS